MNEEQITCSILDAFVQELTKGGSPDLDQFLAKCPDGQKASLRKKLRAAELVFCYHYSSPVSTQTLEKTQGRISELRQIRDRVRSAQAEMALSQQVADPVSRMAHVLKLRTELVTGGPRPQQHQLLLHRGRPGGEAAAKAIERTALMVSRKYGSDQAERLLAELAVSEAPIDLDSICSYLNIIVSQQPMEEGIDGALVTDGQVGGVVINSSVAARTRQRFTLAHEIGHFVMHRHMHWVVEREEVFEGTGNSKEEVEANAFAGMLLMPSFLLGDLRSREPRLAELDDLASKFDVSFSAAATRFVSTSDWPCAFIALHDGVVRWVAWSQHLHGFIQPGAKPHPTSGAATLFEDPAKEEVTRHLPALAWLGASTPDGSEVLEDSRHVGDRWIYSLITAAE